MFTLFSRIPLLVVIVISFLLFSTADYKAKQEFTQTRHSSALSPVGATSNLTMLKLRQPPFFHSLPHPLLKTFGRQTPFIRSNFRGLFPIPFFNSKFNPLKNRNSCLQEITSTPRQPFTTPTNP